MLHKLLLKLPDDVYLTLQKTADQTGQTTEALAAKWLAETTRHFAEDPLEMYIGAFSTNVLDWVDQHDQYIGETILSEVMEQDIER